MGASHADVCRFGRVGFDLYDPRDVLFLRDQRLADVVAGRAGDRLLCHVAGAGGLGRAFRDLPRPHTRDGDGALHLFPLGGLLRADLYLPDPERGGRRFGHVLAVWRDLPRRFPLHTGQVAGDERKDIGRTGKRINEITLEYGRECKSLGRRHPSPYLRHR